MRISARADYAVRATVAIAQAGEAVVSADAVAEAQGIPGSFLEGILTSLRRAGIVASRRGASGGYRLALPPETVSVADVIRAVDGPLVYVRDARPSDIEYGDDNPALPGLWVALRANVRAVLEATTIAHLAARELPVQVQVLVDDPRAWVDATLQED